MNPLSSAPLSLSALALRARCLLVPGALLAFALGATACGSSVGADATPDAAMEAGSSDDAMAPADAGPDAADEVAPDAAPDGPFMTAAHDPFPQVPNQGGPLLTHPQVITITYADDTGRAQEEAYDHWIVGSSWLTTVGAEYGVGAGTVLQDVELTGNAPATITDAQIRSMLSDGMVAGTIPAPSADGNSLYMVYFPTQTTITLGNGGGTSCHEFGGYHESTTGPTGSDFAYAVIPSCPTSRFDPLTDEQQRDVAASHELIEAATDPFPNDQPSYGITLPTRNFTDVSPWVLIGGEVADLCELSPEYYTEDGHMVQKVWSNAAAAAGMGDPCIPQDPTAPYYGTSASPSAVQLANAGDTVTFQLTGFSSAPTTAWTLSTILQGGLQVTPTLSTSHMNNGGTGTLTVQVPTTARPGSYALIIIYSSHSASDYHAWPVGVYVQ